MILVLGIGNLLWADEGFGVRCVERLHARFELPGDVQVMDGGTQGLYLVPYVTEADEVLVFDAVDFGDAKGALRVVRDGDVPSLMGAGAMSLHQVGFQDVLAAAALLGRAPRSLTVIGVQPAVLEDYGGGLSDIVGARVDEAITLALEELGRWGVSATPRTNAVDSLLSASIAHDVYEAGRPSAADACRVGDSRFFPRGDA